MGVDVGQSCARALDFRRADVRGAVQHLPLQVAQVDDVVIDEADPADARGGEIERQRRAEASDADEDDRRRAQLQLALDTDLRQREMAAVARDFARVERPVGLVDRRHVRLPSPKPGLSGDSVIVPAALALWQSRGERYSDGSREARLRPIVLSIAGSDSSAGAGIQADLKAIEVNGAYAATAITAVTAQNTRGVVAIHELPADFVLRQIDAVLDDLDVVAIKTGMLANASIVTAVAASLRRRRPAILVCDPVMRSTAGSELLPADAVGVLRDELLPLATIVTPNVFEATLLTGIEIQNLDDATEAARALVRLGAAAAVVTGGHLPGAPGTDVLAAADGVRTFAAPLIDAAHTHGSGCTFAAALAARLACGDEMSVALTRAKRCVTEAIRHGLPLGGGSGPCDALWRCAAAYAETDRS